MRDSIRNEYIRGTASVGRCRDRVRESRLRWSGHMEWSNSGYNGQSMLNMKLPGSRKRGKDHKEEEN